MRRAAHALVVLLALATSTLAARSLQEDHKQEPSNIHFDLLSTLEPVYDYLNHTGQDWYPTPNCWLFPQPAVSVLYNGAPYQIAFLANASDKSNGKDVANAFCQEKGFEGASDFRQSDFNAGQPPVNSIYIGDGTTANASTASAFKFIECASKPATVGCSRYGTNQARGLRSVLHGYGNTGDANVGNFNAGSSNVGDFNNGSANVGLFIAGTASKGIGFQCSACSGATLLSSP
eukprot:scaffold9.g3210.t1